MTQRSVLESVLDYIIAGKTAQMTDPAFQRELTQWIRFGSAEALRSGDGLFSGLAGNPVLPRWIGQPMMHWFFTASAENQRYAWQVRNSAGIAIFVSQKNDQTHWLEAGRCYQRFALQATALGIRNAFLNQPIEVAVLRPAFAACLGIGAMRPDLVVRFGRGPTLPMSLRWPVDAVLL